VVLQRALDRIAASGNTEAHDVPMTDAQREQARQNANAGLKVKPHRLMPKRV
jgi:hypothetical protein